MYTYGDDFCHLFGLDGPVSVHVVHLERPLELLLRFARGRDVDRQQELLEVDLAAVVRVKRAKHVLAELVGVALREEARVDLEELGPRQLSAWTIPLHQHVSPFPPSLSSRMVTRNITLLQEGSARASQMALISDPLPSARHPDAARPPTTGQCVARCACYLPASSGWHQIILLEDEAVACEELVLGFTQRSHGRETQPHQLSANPTLGCIYHITASRRYTSEECITTYP